MPPDVEQSPCAAGTAHGLFTADEILFTTQGAYKVSPAGMVSVTSPQRSIFSPM